MENTWGIGTHLMKRVKREVAGPTSMKRLGRSISPRRPRSRGSNMREDGGIVNALLLERGGAQTEEKARCIAPLGPTLRKISII